MKKKPALLNTAKTQKRLSAFVSKGKEGPDHERQQILMDPDLRMEVSIWSRKQKRTFSDVASSALREYLDRHS